MTRRLLITVALVVTVVFAAGQTPVRSQAPPAPSGAPLETNAYARQTAEYLLKNLPGARNGTGNVKLVGDPVLLPPFARDGATAGQLPEAFVLATTSIDGAFRESALVAFLNGVPSVRFSYQSTLGFLPLEEREWQQFSEPLAAFYAVAADVTRGPERFAPFLPSDMRKMFDLRAEKNRLFLPVDAVRRLSNDQLHRFAALHLDAVALTAWAALAGITPSARLWSPGDVRQDPEGVIAAGADAVQAIREQLRAAGTLVPERMAAAAGYVRRLLGEGLMVREDPARDGVSSLPDGARMYAIAFGGIFPHVALVDGRLVIVAVDML